jgi:shikimate dehydrogenase
MSSVLRYNKLLREILGLDIAYVPINSGDDLNQKINPQQFAWALRGMPCIGGAISRDIKQSVMSYLDEIDPLALEVQSVNTVLRVGSILKGYNTDAIGFKIAIEWGKSALGAEVRTAVCYGYGGVSSVVVAVLRSLDIKVFLIGRRLDEAERVAAKLGVEVWNGEPVDLFVNAAPVTDSPLHEAVHFIDALKTSKIAFDHEMPGTRMKEYCEDNGILHISGEKMYYPQMIAQWKLFLGSLVNTSNMEQLLQRASV